MTRATTRFAAGPTLVLVHGAGHTAEVWSAVQDHLAHRSLAIDLPGRADSDGDVSSVTIADAAATIEDEVAAVTEGPLVLVGHSAGGIVLPAVAARLRGSVQHLVFVAGLCAREGHTAVEIFHPGQEESMRARSAAMRVEYAGHRYAPVASPGGGPAVTDPKVAMSIDSLNYITQTVSWEGVDQDLPRTFIRCLRDSLQSREIQARLAEECGATQTIDVDAGHNAVSEEPRVLAAVLDHIAASAPR